MEGRPIGSPIQDSRDFSLRLKHVMGKLQRDEKQELVTLVNYLEVKASKNKALKGQQEVKAAQGVAAAIGKIEGTLKAGLFALQGQNEFLKKELAKAEKKACQCDSDDTAKPAPEQEAVFTPDDDVSDEVRPLDNTIEPDFPDEDEALDAVFGGPGV